MTNDRENPAESAGDLIQQITDHAQDIEGASFTRPSGRSLRNSLLAAAILASGAFLAWDLTSRPEREPIFDEQALATGLEFTVYLTVSGIEEFRERTGDLPGTLEEAGLDDPSLRYVTTPAGYRIEAADPAHSVLFTEGDDLEPFEASFWTLQRTGAE